MFKNRIQNLQFRSELLRTIRQLFYGKNFYEVQTPILSADTVIDCHLEPLVVGGSSLPINRHHTRNYYLQTSPEFAMKRLLAEGFNPIFQITPVFRVGDRGPLHNVEFTMLEWYRIGDDYQSGMQFLEELIAFLFEYLVDKFVPVFPADAPRAVKCSQRTYRDAFESVTGINPHTATISELQSYCVQRQIPYPGVPWGAIRDDWLDLLFSEIVQPALDNVIVYDYPSTQPQLAKIRHDTECSVSERFELFLRGYEIASGYHELQDAVELRMRFQANNNCRQSVGRSVLPIESSLLTTMESGFPPCSGTALGIDRLLMVMLGAESIDEVLTFPIEQA